MTGMEVPMHMRFKAVMFDLDGTLLDTIEGVACLVNHALDRLGYPQHSIQTYRKLVGGGIKNLINDSLPSGKRDAENIKDCLDIVFANYEKYYDTNTKIYPGINELLAGLEDMNFKLVVLSNRPDKYTRELIKKYFRENLFLIVSGEVKGVPRKPDPTAALVMAKSLKLRPDEIIYIGDTDIDMQTANKAGMFAVGALWGFRSREELLENGAKLLLEHPTDLIKYIKACQSK
jgi:phosphoglycolate phosphatase